MQLIIEMANFFFFGSFVHLSEDEDSFISVTFGVVKSILLISAKNTA